MEPDRPDTTAWDRVRDHVSANATAYRQRGDTVLEAFADHSTVRQPPEQPLTFSYTVPNDVISELQDHVRDDARLTTDVRYVDVAQTRLYVLETHDERAELRILIAGGIRHQSLQQFVAAHGPARTVVRSVTGTVPLELRHDSVNPFLDGFD